MLRYYRETRLISKNILFTSFFAQILDLYQKPFAQIQNFCIFAVPKRRVRNCVFLNLKNMKFYNRDSELADLQRIEQLSYNNAQMTFIVGRRRIGKTKLLLEATKNSPTLYFFVARKAEILLCQDFLDEVQTKLHLPIYGEISTFSQLFRMLMEISKNQKFNLIIDEFQEFYNINPSIYSDMQHYWDVNKDESKINLLLCGSIYSLMHKIFEDHREPFFGRATQRIFLHPFSPSVLKKILSENNPNYTSEDLLALYTITGGVPKYVELFVDSKLLTHKEMITFITQPNSPFITEGKNLLIEEFGKEYTIYFSILAAIASGHTSRTAIENLLQREISGYLTRLERDYALIKKRVPIFSKSETKNVKYFIEDQFLRFWFRFIYKYSRYIESGAEELLAQLIERNYPTFSGYALEQYFRAQFVEQKQYTKLGGYWDRKGENEIDLIALNELNKTATIAEIKRNKSNIDLEHLRRKSATLYPHLSEYSVEYKALSMEDM